MQGTTAKEYLNLFDFFGKGLSMDIREFNTISQDEFIFMLITLDNKSMLDDFLKNYHVSIDKEKSRDFNSVVNSLLQMVYGDKAVHYDKSYVHGMISRLIESRLYQPEKPTVLKWEDVKPMKGYYLRVADVKELPYFADGVGQEPRDVFVTEQQAKSTQAAAMISQIREQGKAAYGEIVPKGSYAFVIMTEAVVDFTGIRIYWNLNAGTLLRFYEKQKAELFLENNRELVEEYLKTF